jgi:hypothetical protein
MTDDNKVWLFQQLTRTYRGMSAEFKQRGYLGDAEFYRAQSRYCLHQLINRRGLDAQHKREV